MFDNLLLVIILITVLWVGLILFYLYSSKRQETLQKDIEDFQKRLEKEDKN